MSRDQSCDRILIGTWDDCMLCRDIYAMPCTFCVFVTYRNSVVFQVALDADQEIFHIVWTLFLSMQMPENETAYSGHGTCILYT